MRIDKYKKDGHYEDSEGCYYESAVDLIQCGVLGFCGCGDPEENLVFVLKSLRVIDRINALHADEITYEQLEKERLELFKTDAMFLFVVYVFNKMNLAEHGGSVTGCWLTKRGKEVLSDLEEMSSAGMLNE